MKKIFFIFICLVLSIGCFAQATISGGALIHNGQYVTPQTLLPFMNMEQPASQAPIISSPTITFSKTLKNFYQYNNSNGSEILYQCVGQVNNQYVFNIVYSGGGSGIFCDIIRASISGNSLIYGDYIAGGDRTSGGVKSAMVVSNSLIYSTKVSPYSLMSLTSVPSQYYMNVSSGAIDQAGVANYIYHFKTKKNELLSIQLSAQTGNGKYYNLAQDKQNGASSQQLAFEKLYNYYIRGGKSLLTHEDLKNFANKYIKYIQGKK